MRASYNGQPGELTIEHCAILRYNENGKVRKFYQQMLVAFAADNQPAIFWSVSNWGPGPEAEWRKGTDLKGGLKSMTEASYFMAESANSRQVDTKVRGGYTFYTEFKAAANVAPPLKLISELGARPDKTPFVKTLTPDAPARWREVELMQASVSLTSTGAMDCLINGDLSEAIRLRQILIEMSVQIRTLYESSQGQLEMLTLKLAAELRE